MMLLWISWILSLLLVVGLAVLIAALRRERHRSSARISHATELSKIELSAQASDHEDALRLHQRESKRMLRHQDEEAQAQLKEQRQKLADAQALSNQYRTQIMRSVKWERTSRRDILDACHALQFDGVLATNVFLEVRNSPTAKPFLAQLDHVLLSDSSAMVIEAKHWRGVVFDGQRPSTVHASLGRLVPDEKLELPFALRIAPLSHESDQLELFIRSKVLSPRSQVRLQAKRLASYVASQNGQTCWINTSVYYSHPDASLHIDNLESDTEAVGPSHLRQMISRTMQKPGRRDTSPAEQIAPLLARVSTDVVGFGAYTSRWVSAFDQ